MRQKIFHRIFRVTRPGTGPAQALSVSPQRFEVSLPESQFRPRFVWGTAAGISGLTTTGQTQSPPPPPPASTEGAEAASPKGAVAGAKTVGITELPEMTFPDYGVVLRPRPFGQKLQTPDGVHVHAAVLAFSEAFPPPPVVLRFVADADKYVSDGTMKDTASAARLTGRFVEDTGARGEILLTLGRENRTFSGQWRRTDIADDYWHGCEGWRPLAEEGAPAIAAATRGDISVWSGSWDTSFGDMVLLAESGGLVKGAYDGVFGRIEARVEGDKLVGRFYEDNGNWGEFVFVLEPSKSVFKGRWRRLNVEGDDWHEGEGTKVGK